MKSDGNNRKKENDMKNREQSTQAFRTAADTFDIEALVRDLDRRGANSQISRGVAFDQHPANDDYRAIAA
tara:strand:+ start:982 stop:1191 length:210 start_codon:yes stop_codon:yes gene_type:complete